MVATSLFVIFQPQSTQKKPAPSVVMGTKQLPGDFGKIGTTYTIGKGSPLNFTLTGAEYRADRFVGGEFTGNTHGWVPDKSQKILVIQYSVQNPLPREQVLSYLSFDLTAVSADSQNAKVLNKPWVGSNTKYADVTLKPGQKVTATAAFFVSAEGETPKLIVQRGGDAQAAVVRYDLRGKVAKLPASYSDDGFTAKPQVEVSSNGKFPLGGIDVAVTSVEKAATPAVMDGFDSSKDQWVVKLDATGVAPEPARLYYGSLKIRVKTDDGDAIDLPNYRHLLRASRDEVYDAQIPVGETISVRMILELPKGTKPKSLVLQPIDNDIPQRTFLYKIN